MSVALDKNGIARTNIQNGNADFIEEILLNLNGISKVEDHIFQLL